MDGWQDRLTQRDRVRRSTSAHVLDDIDAQLVARIERLRDTPSGIEGRLAELDKEWDVERLLIVNASTLVVISTLASLRYRPLALVPIAVGGFLLQHGLKGWCPPLALFRRGGMRTRQEIDLERYSLKALRGDLPSGTAATAEEILEAAVRR